MRSAPMNAVSNGHAVSSCLASPLVAMSAAGAAVHGAETEYRGLICRGVEETGGLLIGQPDSGPDLVSLFVTGPNPLSATHTLEQHVAWVTDPRHSYVRLSVVQDRGLAGLGPVLDTCARFS